MKNYAYTRSLTDKFTIKGEVSEDGTMIYYVDSEKEEKTLPIGKCFEPFRGEEIALTIVVKDEKDMTETEE